MDFFVIDECRSRWNLSKTMLLPVERLIQFQETRQRNVVHFTRRFKNEISMNDSVFSESNMGEAVAGNDQATGASNSSSSSTILPVPFCKPAETVLVNPCPSQYIFQNVP